uniref:pseudaminic acid cytidylyltransferase n=1 Tax=Ningiella ruwaisensis TaxID=2364274 RepID=UPI0010A00242|nr:pseudaminic acid cytidylyltransferase [Ningiella ruwaisensis]
MNIAIIPARGGSKRIPRKNIRPFQGKAIIAYPIEAALESGVFSKVYVSSDDEEVGEVAKRYGASLLPLRPAKLSDDHTGTSAVMRYELSNLVKEQTDKSGTSLNRIDYCCCIYATTPLLTPDALQKAWEMLQSNQGLDYVFSAARFSFPIQRALLKSENGGVQAFDPQSIKKRSQDLPECFHDAGQFYFGKTDAWLQQNAVFSEKSEMLILPPHRVQDIDTPDDWEHAERLYRLLQQP